MEVAGTGPRVWRGGQFVKTRTKAGRAKGPKQTRWENIRAEGAQRRTNIYTVAPQATVIRVPGGAELRVHQVS